MKLETNRIHSPSDASSPPRYNGGLSDLDRERLIELYQEAMLLEDNPVRRQLASQSMLVHIRNRSPEQVALMEQFKGLR